MSGSGSTKRLRIGGGRTRQERAHWPARGWGPGAADDDGMLRVRDRRME